MLKFMATRALVPMFVALFVGACETIVGAALSTVVPAVKLKVEASTGVPLVLVTALVTFTVYCDPDNRLPVGAMLMTWPPPITVQFGVR